MNNLICKLDFIYLSFFHLLVFQTFAPPTPCRHTETHIQRDFLKPGFHAVFYIGTMPRLVQIETGFFGTIHCMLCIFVFYCNLFLLNWVKKVWACISKVMQHLIQPLLVIQPVPQLEERSHQLILTLSINPSVLYTISCSKRFSGDGLYHINWNYMQSLVQLVS